MIPLHFPNLWRVEQATIDVRPKLGKKKKETLQIYKYLSPKTSAVSGLQAGWKSGRIVSFQLWNSFSYIFNAKKTHLDYLFLLPQVVVCAKGCSSRVVLRSGVAVQDHFQDKQFESYIRSSQKGKLKPKEQRFHLLGQQRCYAHAFVRSTDTRSSPQ